MAMTYSTSMFPSRAAGKVCDISCNVTFVPPSVDEDRFAFARIKGELCLVQGACSCLYVDTPMLTILTVSAMTPASALTTIDVKLFRHEFITIFRLSTTMTVHPADIRIIELIDDELMRYEVDNETVFLARELMERMRKLTDRGVRPQQRRQYSPVARRR